MKFLRTIMLIMVAVLTACAPCGFNAAAEENVHEGFTAEKVTPAGVDKATGSGVYVYTNNTDSPKKLSTDTYNFRYSNLLVFDKNGRACQVGNNLVRVSDGDAGTWLREVTLPAGGFAVALTSVSSSSPFGRLYTLALDGGIIYNSMTGVLVELYADFDGETLTAYLPPEKAPTENAKQILLVGNSSTYFAAMPSRLRALIRNFGINAEVDSCTEGSAYLAYFADGSRSAGKAFRAALAKKKYDLVVLQDASAAKYEDTLASVKVLKPLIEANGAEFIFYTNTSGTMSRANTRVEIYDKLFGDFKVKSSPTCLAFASFIVAHPDINLFYIDNSHNSAEGAYLVACTLFRTIFGLSPVGNKEIGELSPATASLIERFVAAEVDKYESARKEQYSEPAESSEVAESSEPAEASEPAAESSEPAESSEVTTESSEAAAESSVPAKGEKSLAERALPFAAAAALLLAATAVICVIISKKKKN